MPLSTTYSVIDTGGIPDNLLQFFEDNQATAFTEIGHADLKPFRDFSDSVANRAVPVYPSIAFSEDDDAIDYSTGTQPFGGYTVTFEIAVQSTDPSEAVRLGRLYARAVKLMIRNCPPEVVAADTGALLSTSSVQTIQGGRDPIRANERQNDFLQMMQVRAAFTLYAAEI